jgi:hypothetical protein
MIADYIMLIVRWSYVPTDRASTRNFPSEVRRILVGPIAAGPKRYPWILEQGLEEFLEPYVFSLIKPKEHRKTRGKVGPAEGALSIFKIKQRIDENDLSKIIKSLVEFCDEWKVKGKYGIRIVTYQIAISQLMVYR